MSYCPKCGKELAVGAGYCQTCGNEVGRAASWLGIVKGAAGGWLTALVIEMFLAFFFLVLGVAYGWKYWGIWLLFALCIVAMVETASTIAHKVATRGYKNDAYRLLGDNEPESKELEETLKWLVRQRDEEAKELVRRLVGKRSETSV